MLFAKNVKPKQLKRPVFDRAVQLTPLQLNALRYQNKHTILTREQIDALASSASEKK